MINMNEMMKMILEDKERENSCLEVDAIVDEIVNKTKIIKECIIYDKEGTLDEEKINFKRIKKMVGDCVSYEVSCNEFRFNRDIVSTEQYLMLAEKLNYMLTQKYTKKMVIYIILHEDEMELRFHTYRKDEKLWLDKDLNKYDAPILCWM